MTTPNQLAVPAPGFAITTLDDMQMVATKIAGSKMFGISNADEAFTLMLLCSSEGINPLLALRQYHMIQGRPSMRADAMVGKFEAAGGGIFWHARTDKMAVATFYADKRTMSDPAAIERARTRAAAMIVGDTKTEMEHAHPGEVTIVRTMEDAIATGLATCYSKTEKGPDGKFKIVLKDNWQMSGRQMLAARASTEGVRAINPGLIAGIVSEDEARDIADQTQERIQQIERNPNANDRQAMEAIMQQHLDDAEAAKTDGERKRLQGLAADMRCRIADLDVKSDAPKTIEAQAEIVQHAENEEPEPEKAAPTAKPEPAKQTQPTAADDWRTVDFSHKSPKVGSLLDGKTVGDINASEPGTIARAKKILGGFMQTMDEVAKQIEKGATVAFAPADMRLYTALCDAECWFANQAPK